MSVGVERSTIAGVATGTPDGGIAIVRISGPRAEAIARALLVDPLPRRRRATLRRLHVGEHAVVIAMPGPRSFTGEDVVELQIHAGVRNVTQVLDAALEAGAVAAGPGDFSRRAFANGRLTLDQAEGLAAVIGARTQAALDQARRLVAGELGLEVERLRAQLERLQVEVEANLDFPEDVSPADEARFAQTVAAIAQTVRTWLERFEAGKRARARARVVIAGPPNAGKSALFNALLGRTRALVSSRAGTTRDYVEAELELGGRELTLVDTAGLRTSDDAIEEAGVALSHEQIAGAEVVVWVEGRDQPRSDDARPPAATVIEVENKADLDATSKRPGWLQLSAESGIGLDALRAALEPATRADADAPWIGLARHGDRAREALAALDEAHDQLDRDLGLELVAFSLGLAVTRLGEITGRSALGPVGEDVLDAIFSGFCIGK